MRIQLLHLTALIVLLSGCGAPAVDLGEVEGVVLYNGTPLPEVVVQFVPDPEKDTRGPNSEATTDAQGRYRLRLADQRAGAVVGWHRVILDDPNVDRPAQGEPVKHPSRVPSLYTSLANTPLRKEVRPGAQVVNLELIGPKP